MFEINIAFDIDGTLAFGFDDPIDFCDLETKEPWVTSFKEHGLFLNAITPHILCPGIMELLQLLIKMSNVKISFISAGDKIRNEPFVEQLLCLAVGKEQYDIIKDDIKIISRDTIKTDQQKKRLERVGLSSDQLSSAVLVDDSAFFSPEEQKENLLILPSINSLSLFRDLFKFYSKLNTEQFINDLWSDFVRINQLFYLTGLIFYAIEKTEKNNQTLIKTLDQIQFNHTPWKLQFGEISIKPYNEKEKSLPYFLYGLNKLKTINSELQFFSPGEFFKKPSADTLIQSPRMNLTRFHGFFESSSQYQSGIINQQSDDKSAEKLVSFLAHI